MYLKSIEVQGFKSFANRIVFQFHNGITGIVGPNGSGKSNVADAVRWVLGEQRAKQLRGGNMQDVIFSGTENRKPLSYASVGITLDNSDHKLPVDFEEVTVTRKLYRSGESEYLMNGRSCRLKDINELFYDTGIGKEGYSIIGQGQIDKILSGKPEERRELFDEAAGIVKFKRRKNTSLKKLEEEQQNLVRVTDILSELEKQYGPLKKQSETAREYLKKKEELKKLDINLFLVQTETLRAQEKETLEALSRAEEELAETKKQYEAMKEEYAEVEGRIEEIDLAMETATKQLNDTKLIRQQYENRIDLLKEQIKSVRTSDAHYVERKETVEAEIQKREGELRDLKAQREDLEDQMREKEAQSESERKTLTNLQEEKMRSCRFSPDVLPQKHGYSIFTPYGSSFVYRRRSLPSSFWRLPRRQRCTGRIMRNTKVNGRHCLRRFVPVRRRLPDMKARSTVFSRKSPEKMNRSESDRALTTESSPGWNR